MSTTTCTAIVLADDPVQRAETVAVAGFLAGDAGATRTSYATGLRIAPGVLWPVPPSWRPPQPRPGRKEMRHSGTVFMGPGWSR